MFPPDAPKSPVDLSAVVSLIGSMGSSGAAIFVMWFLTNSFNRTTNEERQNFAKILNDMNNRLYELARDKGEIIRTNAVALEKLAGAVDGLSDIVERMSQRLPANATDSRIIKGRP